MDDFVYYLQNIHEKKSPWKSLDKCGQPMVKYFRIIYRVEWEEYSAGCNREFGSLAVSPNNKKQRKVRPGANNY